jgi:hypothetical protein
MSFRFRRIHARMCFWWTVLALVPVAGSGCGAPSQVISEVPATNVNLRAVRDAYFEASKLLGRPPASKEELIPFLKKLGDPAQLLRSPDDGEDFVIVFGIDPMSTDNLPCVWVYERHGKDGRRWFLRDRRPERLIEDNFRKLPFPAGHKPAF